MLWGDLGPQIAVPAVVESLWAHTHVSFLLFGNQEIINAEIPLKLEKHVRRRLEVRHTSTTVDANDKPSSVIRSKLDSSMAMAMSAVAEGEADVCVSAGNTGALMALGFFSWVYYQKFLVQLFVHPYPLKRAIASF